jgi:hypothetical protein
VPDPVAHVAPSSADWVMVHWPQASRDLVARLQASGRSVALNGLFDAGGGVPYGEALRLGVDAVTAPDPKAARAALAGLGEHPNVEGEP